MISEQNNYAISCNNAILKDYFGDSLPYDIRFAQH